ncbi:MAG TPA: hypothetical protein VM536_07715 [Chloroflexia bacterium]|nr:hypothetical protein [Chloroflexia bacterium]
MIKRSPIFLASALRNARGTRTGAHNALRVTGVRHGPRAAPLLTAALIAILGACDAPRVGPTPVPTVLETATPAATRTPGAPPIITPATPAAQGLVDPSRILATILLAHRSQRLVVDSGSVWVLHSDQRLLTRIDATTNKVVDPPITLSFSPWNLSAGAGAVWVTGNGASVLARVAPDTGQVTSFGVGANPIAQAAFGFGAAWTANAGGTTVSRVDLAAGTVTTFRAGRQPHGIAVGAGSVWVGNHDESAVVRLDPETQAVVARIRLPTEPHTLAFGAGYLWADGYHADGIIQVDPATNTVRNGVIPVGFTSDVFAVDDTALWIASVITEQDGQHFPGTHEVVRIDPMSQQIVERLVFATAPAAVALDAGSLWVALEDPPQVLRIRR